MLLLMSKDLESSHKWIWKIVLILLWTVCVSVRMQQLCDTNVYISQTDLALYYASNNESAATIVPDGGSFILRNCTSVVNSNHYLVYSGTNTVLPNLPRTVDHIAISWMTSDPQASYVISVSDVSTMQSFENISLSVPAEGFIVDQSDGITIHFPCTMDSNIIGILNITIYINATSAPQTPSTLISTYFLLKKDCRSLSNDDSNDLLTPVEEEEEGSGTDTDPLLPYSSSSSIHQLLTSSPPMEIPSSSPPMEGPSSIFIHSSPVFTPSAMPPTLQSSSFSFHQSTFPSQSTSSFPTTITQSTMTTTRGSQMSVEPTPTLDNRSSSSDTQSTLTYSSSSSDTLPSGSPGLVKNDEGLPWLLFAIVFAPVAGILLLSIFIIVCCLCCIKCSRKKSHASPSGFFDNPDEVVHTAYDNSFEYEEEEKCKKDTFPVSLWIKLSWGTITATLPSHVQKRLKTVNIDRRKLTITNTFLRVDNGCLSHGLLLMDSTNPMSLLNQGTMLKMLIGLGESGHREEILKFIEQGLSLQGLEHRNILQVLGMSVEDNCVPVIIYPIMEYGNLHSFLELSRVSPESCPLNPFGPEYKANFGLQLASAIKFLTSKGLLHHDIALRNCWLDTGYVVKLADGALSQEFYPESYSTIKGALRPVKWSALETLQEGLTTAQSNVWSFGVVLWEIFSMAQTPYVDVPNCSIISHLMMDERLPKPDECIDEIYELMRDCWRARGEDRPNIKTILNRLTDISTTKLPSLVYPTVSSTTGYTPFSPRSADPTYTTFMSSPDAHAPMTVSMERYSYTNLDDPGQSIRHSGVSLLSDALLKRSSIISKKRASGGHMSTTSKRKSGDHVSLSFSILSGDDDDIGSSSSGSDNEGEGSFPSTLKSTKSTTTGTATDSQPFGGGSISTLQQTSPLGIYPPAESPDITSKTSTVDDSGSIRSSVLLQPTSSHSTSGTDRSSFYSTGIDSISTTFSTPLPSNPVSANNTPSIELKTYSSAATTGNNNDDSHVSRLRPMDSSSSTSPFTGKSTDSGIRSDEEQTNFNNSNEYVSSNTTIVPLRTSNGLSSSSTSSSSPTKDTNSTARNSSYASRNSFDLGLSDMSSELMAAFEQFSFDKK